jgi:hypothetical protein
MRIRVNRRHCRARLIKDLPCVAVADEADGLEEERADAGDISSATNRIIDVRLRLKKCQARINQRLTGPPTRGSINIIDAVAVSFL